MLIALSVFAVVLAVTRFFIPSRPLSPAGSYQAVAHLFVGGLIGAGYWQLVVALSAVELVAFVVKKRGTSEHVE